MIKICSIYIFIFILCFISFKAISNSAGPPLSHSNAPNEPNCTRCHSGNLITSGTDWNNINLSSDFTGNGYIPDSTYTIKISIFQNGISKWGFQATVLDANDSMAGSFTGSDRVQNSSSTNPNREYVFQTFAGTSSSGKNYSDWIFKWKAPSTNLGGLTFYVSLVAANGDFDHTDDSVYAKTFFINPSQLLPVAKAMSNDTLVCIKADVALYGKSSDSIKVWNWQLKGANPSFSNSQNPVIKYSSAGSYWAVLTTKNSKGISKADSLKITVSEKTKLVLKTENALNQFCEGEIIKLSVLPRDLTEYNFYIKGFLNQNSGLSTFDYTNAKNLDSIFVTNFNGGCINKSNNLILDIKPTPNSGFSPTLLGNRSYMFSPKNKGYKKYLWHFNDGSNDSSSQEILHIFKGLSPKFWVALSVTDSFGCISKDSMEIDLTISTSKIFNDAEIRIYPLPADKRFKIEIQKELINSTITLYDGMGKLVIKKCAENPIIEFETTYLTEGTYFLSIISRDKRYVRPIFIIH